MIYSADIIERFSKVATASVADACDQVVGKRCYMNFDMKNRINDKRVVGPAITVLFGDGCQETTAPTHALDMIESAQPGDVLVQTMMGDARDVALFGGIMACGSTVKEIAGAILDGGVRDTTEIKGYGFPVYATSISPGTAVGRFKTYASNVPVVCAGVDVCPGDLIVADPDGVVVVPQANVEDVLKVTEDIEAKEALQAKLIQETKSLKEGLAKYNRIYIPIKYY